MSELNNAMLIAIAAHGGDKNKHDGEIYLLHVARVVHNVQRAGGDEAQQAIAWLHDAVEDTTVTLSHLSSCGISNEVVTAVDALTKRKGESNEEYYHRVKLNDDARFVKFHGDMKDNFRRNHQITDTETRARMAAKYSLGMDILG